MSRRSRLEWIFVAFLLAGLTTTILIADAGARKGAATQMRSVVSVIDTATNKPATKAIKVGRAPTAIAITPDGRRVYVVKN